MSGDRFAGPCVVCGESVAGSPYVALSHFFVGTDEADGIIFRPPGSPMDHANWDDVEINRAVHLRCVVAYFDGVHADAVRRRTIKERGDDA